MIYQLKILLQHTSPPVWRRILVHQDMMLSDLHETIQVAFEWFDSHLHCFEARRTNGVSLTNRNLSIGINHEQLQDLVDYDYDEEEEKLSNWLIKEKDKLVYVYDFGDDWRHEIVLEKIMDPMDGMAYPYCVKVMRGPVEEDSGGFMEEAEEVDPKELQSLINEDLQRIAQEIPSAPLKSKGEMPSQWSRLFHLATEFHELSPWRWLDDDQIFAVQHPETGEYAYCSVMGTMEEEFGLAAFIGQDGLEYLRRILASPVVNQDFIYDNHSMVLSFCSRGELSPKDHDLIKQEGSHFHGENKWPLFRSMVPGYYPWYLSDEEAEWFSVILERAIDICSRAKSDLEIKEFSQHEVCLAQSAVKKKDKVVWQDTFVSKSGAQKGEEFSKLLVSEIDLQRLKSNSKKYNVPLEIGVFYSPEPVQENPDEKPYFPVVFVAAERKKQMIVFHEMFLPVNKDRLIQSAFLSLLENLNAIPREVWMTREMYLILNPILDRLSLSVMQVERLPIIENVKSSMHQFNR